MRTDARLVIGPVVTIVMSSLSFIREVRKAFAEMDSGFRGLSLSLISPLPYFPWIFLPASWGV